jgi:LPXTG-site transpeptidase (sortase) family protein
VVVLLIVGLLTYLGLREWRTPSGGVVVETQDGPAELRMPFELATPPTDAAVDLKGRVPQPPRTIDIPRIGVHADVFMMAEESPHFRSVGWLFGTAMPSSPGNMVFYAARDGDAAVFAKLDELQPGDPVTVASEDITFVYRVTTIQEVDAGRSELLLPTAEPMATLITDAGE